MITYTVGESNAVEELVETILVLSETGHLNWTVSGTTAFATIGNPSYDVRAAYSDTSCEEAHLGIFDAGKQVSIRLSSDATDRFNSLLSGLFSKSREKEVEDRKRAKELTVSRCLSTLKKEESLSNLADRVVETVEAETASGKDSAIVRIQFPARTTVKIDAIPFETWGPTWLRGVYGNLKLIGPKPLNIIFEKEADLR